MRGLLHQPTPGARLHKVHRQQPQHHCCHAKNFGASKLPPHRVLGPTAVFRRRGTSCGATTGSQLQLNIADTTITIPFSRQQAQELNAAITALLHTFAEKQKAQRPRRWESMEYKFAAGGGAATSASKSSDAAAAATAANGSVVTGGAVGQGVDLFEAFCNPNAYSTAFDAKVLMRIKAGGIQITTEGRLSALKSDLEASMAAS